MPRPRSAPRSGEAVLSNSELARIFNEIADMLEILGEVVYRAVAYRRVADAVERWPEDVAERYRSGAPLEALRFQSGTGEYDPPMVDPGIDHPELADSDSVNNNFEYGDDPDGDIVPLAAHIRKAYPRDQTAEHETGTPDPSAPGAESRTQTQARPRRLNGNTAQPS